MDRINAVSQAYLRWAHRHRRDQPANERFLEATDARVDGEQVTGEELDDVVELLLHRGLVSGPTDFVKPRVPNPAELTSVGIVCVTDHDADVQRWNASQNMSYINQPVSVTGNGNQVAAFSSNVTQTQRTEMTDVQTLQDVAQRALDGLDTYEMDEDDAEAVRGAAEKALTETAEGDLEPGRLAKLAMKLYATLHLFLGTAAGHEFAQRLMDSILPLTGIVL